MQGELSTKAHMRKQKSKLQLFRRQLDLQSMLLPGLLMMIVFSYIPMYGILIAFKKYEIVSGIAGIFNSPWAGLKYFKEFFTDDNFANVMTNTLGMSVFGLIIGFPTPIIFALLLNEIRQNSFKKLTQTISYLPHFISWVVYGGLVINLLASNGIINYILTEIGLVKEPIQFMAEPRYFWEIAIISGILKGLGWNSILYIASIASVDPALYESAVIDGAGRFRRMWYITLPSILGTIVIMMLFSVSNILRSDFDRIWMLQNSLNVSAGETIDTYVYKLGFQYSRFSYSTAVGLFQSVVGIVLIYIMNFTSTKFLGKGIFAKDN